MKSRITSGAYYDSVTLMNVARELSELEGIDDAAVVMGTQENRAILEASGLLTPEVASSSAADLAIAVRADDERAAGEAFSTADRLLAEGRAPGEARSHSARTLDGALKTEPGLNLALISVAGPYAGDVADEALDRGLHVMLFSDNVPLETEVALKRKAHDAGLLVMGPDCGTAILNGVPLGFANAVSWGPVGIVAASGTGLQEVSCFLSNEGVGVSQALGTGGRDVTDAVGGITFLDALEALGEDASTEIVLLVSKPPDPSVEESIRRAADGIGKPVVTVFRGASPSSANDAWTLAEAAAKTAALSRGETLDPDTAWRPTDDALLGFAKDIASARDGRQRYVRALMSGGTFASEAVVVFGNVGMTDVRANAGRGAKPLDDPLRSVGNTVVDMGADAFTVGRPHPMIDYSLRLRRLAEESRDAETAVVLLDVVLGYGANPDPASELEDAVRDASSRVAVVCSITGTERDPQVRSAVEKRLGRAGAFVMSSNEQACRLAGAVVRILGEN